MATEQTLDTVNNSNLMTVADTPSWTNAQKSQNDTSHASRLDKLLEMTLQNALAAQQRNNQLAEIHMGKTIENLSSTDPVEAASTAKLFRGEGDSSIGSILAQISAGQIGAKTAMTVPPETGTTQLFAQLNALTSQNNQNTNIVANMNQGTLSSMAAIAEVLAKIGR
jgi:hypothetical protein